MIPWASKFAQRAEVRKQVLDKDTVNQVPINIDENNAGQKSLLPHNPWTRPAAANLEQEDVSSYRATSVAAVLGRGNHVLDWRQPPDMCLHSSG